MVADGSLDVLRILSNASAVIAEGEVLQLMTANDTTSDETTYMQVIEAKTAALFAAACRVGAVVAARPAVEEAALERSEEHTSELQSLMRISYAVFCLKKKKHQPHK